MVMNIFGKNPDIHHNCMLTRKNNNIENKYGKIMSNNLNTIWRIIHA